MDRLKAYMAVFLLWASALFAQGKHRIVSGVGFYDFKRQDPFAVETRLEVRFHRQDVLKPLLGFSGTTLGTTYVYAGLYYDWLISQKHRLWLIPSFSIGYYHQGGGKDLGCFLEFRSQVELAYAFESGVRLSVGLAHTSNARQAQLQNDKDNPGCEHLFIGISLPLGRN